MSFDISSKIESLFANKDSAIARDLKINLTRFMTESSLSKKEALLALLATATSVQNIELGQVAREGLQSEDLSLEQIREASESAAMMGMLNTYYRFKHMVGKAEDYRSAGLRMMALSSPTLGKELFEMLSLAVSVLNGCETCIKAHEQTLRDVGVNANKIHDLARIAAVVRGISALNPALA